MLSSKNLWRLIRLYLLFGSINVAYKCYKLLSRTLKAKKIWKHLPGKDVELTGQSVLKNANRIPDWIIDEVQACDSDAPLIKFPYIEPLLICNTPESVQWMLKDEFDNITKPKLTDPAMQLMTKWLGEDGIFVLMHGDNHHKHDHKVWLNERKTAAKIFTRKSMTGIFHETFAMKAEQALERVTKEAGGVIDMQELFFSFTMDSIEKFFMGTEVNSVSGGMSVYARSFDKAHYHMMHFVYNNIGVEVLNRALLPYPFGSFKVDGTTMDSWFTKFYGLFNEDLKEFYKAIESLDNHIYKYIKETRKDPNLPNRKDIIANFLNGKEEISDKRLRDLVLNLTIAGRDTTACALSWLFFELTQNLEVQEKLIAEIDEKLGKKTPTLEDLSPENVPYLHGALYETLRLHPPVPFDFKKTSKDIYYKDGTLVPKGTQLGFIPCALGRNSKRYPNPEKFDPNRWIPFKQPSLYEFPVFQAGPRFCLGKDMAQFEAKFLTVKLLQQFKFTMDPNEAKKISYSLLLTQSIVNNETKTSNNLWLKPIKR